MVNRNGVDGRQAGVPPILFRPSSVSGPLALVMAAARGITPLGALTAAGVDTHSRNPPHLPCSQSDIRLAAVVTDDAGGLLHHLFTHDPQPRPRGPAPVGWFVLCCSCRQGHPCLDLLFHPVTWPAKGWESGSSSGTEVPATVPLLDLNRSSC